MTGIPAPPGATESTFLPHPGQVADWSVTDPNHTCLTARLHGPLEDGPPARVAVLTGPGSSALNTSDPDVLDDAARMLTESARWLRAQQDTPAGGDDLPGLEIGAAP